MLRSSPSALLFLCDDHPFDRATPFVKPLTPNRISTILNSVLRRSRVAGVTAPSFRAWPLYPTGSCMPGRGFIAPVLSRHCAMLKRFVTRWRNPFSSLTTLWHTHQVNTKLYPPLGKLGEACVQLHRKRLVEPGLACSILASDAMVMSHSSGGRAGIGRDATRGRRTCTPMIAGRTRTVRPWPGCGRLRRTAAACGHSRSGRH